MNQQMNVNSPEIEEKIRQKIEEFNAAENEARSRDELTSIYRELKDLRYQLALCNKTFHFNQSGY